MAFMSRLAISLKRLPEPYYHGAAVGTQPCEIVFGEFGQQESGGLGGFGFGGHFVSD